MPTRLAKPAQEYLPQWKRSAQGLLQCRSWTQPGLSWLDSAPAQLRDHLLNQVKEGQLPHWSDWFAS
jgi:hypothetical protein